jgi:endoglucanase
VRETRKEFLSDRLKRKTVMSNRKKVVWAAMSVMALLAMLASLGVIRLVHQLQETLADAKSNHAQASAASVVPSPSPTPLYTGLSVRGTQILDAQGQVVTLIGAARPSLEYLCAGDGHFQMTDFLAMRSWGMNVVRIPLSSAFWANLGGTCPNYHLTVTTAVANAEAAGLYVILDLQWNAPLDLPIDGSHGGGQYPMPDAGRDLAFWHDLATIYRSDPDVLFDLFGEPHDISWDTWLNGGEIRTSTFIGNQYGTGEGFYQAIGMANLVTQVRAIAPKNLIILGGLEWGYDLAGLDQGYELQAPNILYATHPFDQPTKSPADWPHDFGDLSEHAPVIATEFGDYDCQTGYIATAIAYFTAHQMSWLAWAWNVGRCDNPSLLLNWSGAPNIPYGAYIRQQARTASCLAEETRSIHWPQGCSRS